MSLAPTVCAQNEHTEHSAHASSAAIGLVKEVRNATRTFADVKSAIDAGYSQFLGCVSGQQDGAMGVHYVNTDLVGDGVIDVQKPEALMYEMRNGRLVLLGVEYIVMADKWNQNNPLPPTLMGQVFTFNSSPNRYGLPPYYALHVWAWRENPRGAFVDWNPQVSCDGFTPGR